jgi:membrane-bound ClpP family serine protease
MTVVQWIRRVNLGIFLALLGIGLTCVQLMLPTFGYELGVGWGSFFLGLTVFSFAVALIVVFWSLIEGLWYWVRRDAELELLIAQLETAEQDPDELKQENEEHIAEAEALKKVESDVGQAFFTPQREVGGVRGSRYYKGEPSLLS